MAQYREDFGSMTVGVEPPGFVMIVEPGILNSWNVISTPGSIGDKGVFVDAGNARTRYLCPGDGLIDYDTDILAVCVKTSPQSSGCGLRVTEAEVSDYNFFIDGANDLRLFRNNVSVVTVPGTFVGNRLELIQNRITGEMEGRVWTDGDPRPSTAQLTYTDPSPLTSGKAGAFGGADFTVDEIGVGTNGDPAPYTGGNTAPVVDITAPAHLSEREVGANINFTGTATDAEDGNLTSSIAWSSDLDGALGTGGSINVSTLSIGTHVITASVVDSGALPGSDSITITVTDLLPVADFLGTTTGLVLTTQDLSYARAPGATITAWDWSLEDGVGEIASSTARHPTFVVPTGGTYNLTLTVTDSNGNEDSITTPFTFGTGFSLPPYDLPTTKYAGRLIIQLDPSIDWAGIAPAGVIIASDDTAWLDYYRLPVAGGTECRVKSEDIQDHADQPVRSATVNLMLSTASGSLSSSAVDSPFNLLSGSFSPAIFGKRRIIIQDQISGAPGSTNPDDYKPRFWGVIDEHPAAHSGTMSIFARDMASQLMIPKKGEDVQIGTPGTLVTLAEANQAVADAVTYPGAWPLKTEAGLDWAFPAFLLGPITNGLQFMRDAAQQRGAVVRWWYDETTERFQLTQFVLQVDKTVPDFTYGPGTTKDIPSHGSDVSNYRNYFELWYVPQGATEPVKIVRGPTAAELAAYGLQPLIIRESSTGNIDSAAEANVMLDSVETALRVPATLGTRRLPFNSSIEINSLIEFTADARISQENILLYVTGWKQHKSVSPNGDYEGYIDVQLRGAPVGQMGAWLRSFHATEIGEGGASVPEEPVVVQDPLVEYEAKGSTTVGTLRWYIQERGIPITGTDVRIKEPGTTWTPFTLPARGPGEMSVLRGVPLRFGEYEHDAPLTGDSVSYIHARYTLPGPKIVTIVIQGIDADAFPKLLSVDVRGTLVEAIGDDDVLSIGIVKTSGGGGAYSSSQDTNQATFSVPVPIGDVWTLDVTGYDDITANQGNPGVLSHTITVIVSNVTDSGGEDPENYPYVSVLTSAPPAIGDSVAEITIELSNVTPGAAVMEVFANFNYKEFYETSFEGGTVLQSRHNSNIPFYEIGDFTSPPISGLPTSPTLYDLGTQFVRRTDTPASFPGGLLGWVVFMDVRVVLYTTGGVYIEERFAPGINWSFTP